MTRAKGKSQRRFYDGQLNNPPTTMPDTSLGFHVVKQDTKWIIVTCFHASPWAGIHFTTRKAATAFLTTSETTRNEIMDDPKTQCLWCNEGDRMTTVTRDEESEVLNLMSRGVTNFEEIGVRTNLTVLQVKAENKNIKAGV